MRFKQFIESATSEPTFSGPADIAAIIRRDCAPFLREGGGNFAWRGVNGTDDSYIKWYASTERNRQGNLFGIGAVRTDRNPKDSSAELHDILNDYFIDSVGLPLRSTSLFVLGTAGRGIAENYGQLFGIFPIGKFNYAWSPLISDATNALQFMWDGNSAGEESPKFMAEIEKAWAAFSKQNEIPPQSLDDFFDVDKINASGDFDIDPVGLWDYEDGMWPNFVHYFLRSADPWKFNEGLKQALGSKIFGEHEVMIVCDKYYLVAEEMMREVARELKK